MADRNDSPSHQETVEEHDERKAREKRRFKRTIWFFVAGIVAILLYSFAVQETEVDLGEVRSPVRREQLVRILRALVRPDLVTFDKEEITVVADVLVPCPPGGNGPETDTSETPYLIVTPSCASPDDTVTVEGVGFEPRSRTGLLFIPDSEFAVSLPLMEPFEVGQDGTFSVDVELPERESENPQQIEALTRVNVGSYLAPVQVWTDANNNGVEDEGEKTWSPRPSENLTLTLEKIMETVLMAFLATTIGTAIALPLSFLASRNLMRDVSTTVTNLSLNLLAIPIGAAVGIMASQWMRSVSETLSTNDWARLVLMVLIPIGMFFALRWALPVSEEEPPPRSLKIQRNLVIVASLFAFLIWLNVFAVLSIHVGRAIAPHLGVFAFLGNFVAIMGEILELTLPAIAALFGIGIFMALGSRIGYFLRSHLSRSTILIVNLPLAALAAGIIGMMIGRLIDWLYEVTLFDIIPGISAGTFAIAGFIIGALTGVYLAIRKRTSDTVKIGLIIYYIARTIFNTLRSIEPLVMVIVFVVWVGFGPFAGMLALSLHTAAALAKLYSEQVESIQVGPLEAVRATGATRLQTVVYAVVPQIVPPYISFTMYRWDINVRMSTIIGFAGGGGIGFLLQQNIQLLQYRAAAAQMLAIAIVVATMDYISSRLRERMV